VTKAARTFNLDTLKLTAAHVLHGHTFATDKHAFLTTARVDEAGRRNLLSSECNFPRRIDPDTGECGLFLGRNKGPDRAVGEAVAGAFGMPAMQPAAETRTHLSCPGGMVLGRDDLCYPRAVLRRDSRFRKWRPGTRPVLTGGEVKAIAKARSAIMRGRARMSGLGVSVQKK